MNVHDSLGQNTVAAVHDDGATLVLRNGSRWCIASAVDRRRVAGWESVGVWVTWDKFGSGDIILIPDHGSDESVRARFGGTVE